MRVPDLFLVMGVLQRLVPLPYRLALLEVELVLEAVPPDSDIHVGGGVLRGTGAKAVQAKRILVVAVPVVVVFAAGVELAEDQLPVPLLLFLVPVDGTASPLVLHLDTVVQVAGEGDETAVALPGLVDGVG